ncbi:MAG: GtrA family protein [Methylovirgula sp.]
MQALRSRVQHIFGAGALQLFDDLWRYGICSALALALDWGLLVLLVALGVNYLIAAATSFTAGMLLAYFGSVRFVFRDRRSQPPLAEAVGFFIIGFLGLGVNVLLLFIFVKWMGLSAGIAKAPTVVGVFIFNFVARRTMLFTGALTARPTVAEIALDLE